MSKIVERIEREAGVPDLVDILAERIAPTDLLSLLLEVFRRRAACKTPSDVLQDYRRNSFVRPSDVAPNKLLAWEQLVFDHLPADVEALELSGSCRDPRRCTYRAS